MKVFVFAGTIAELIKLFPVIERLKATSVPFSIIASGQNDLSQSDLLPIIGPEHISVRLSDSKIRQTALGLFTWLAATFIRGFYRMGRVLPKGRERRECWLLVHGDTVSTLLGAVLGRMLGLKIGHVEAGLRSFNYFKPFPEEICRVIVSRLTHASFCPNDWAVNNLKKHRKMTKLNTVQNTLAESMLLALNAQVQHPLLAKLPPRFFIFVLHRQENIYDPQFVEMVLQLIEKQAQVLPCVCVIHKPTEVVFEKMGIMQRLNGNPAFIMTHRLPYIVFTQTLQRSEMIITDGGSNQEETFYLGKPCLVLRSETERTEGLNANVVLSMRDRQTIEHFIAHYPDYARPVVSFDRKPSEIIVSHLQGR